MLDELHKHKLEKVEQDVGRLKRTVWGSDGEMGLRSMVLIIWRTYVWLLCLVSGAVGSGVTWIVMR